MRQLVILALLAGRCAAASLDFQGAQWIWFKNEPAVPLDQCPEGTVYFRTIVDLPAVKSAEVAITCDNLFSLWVNGKPVGESTDPHAWNEPKRYDITKLVVPGRNVLAIEAMNTVPGPAGLILKLSAPPARFVSDGAWKANDTADLNWQQLNFDDSTWRTARVLGAFGMKPWAQFDVPAVSAAKLVETDTPPTAEFKWPEAIAFLGDDCSLYRGRAGGSYESLNVTIFNPRDSRAFPEHDLPAPIKVGRKLYALKPAQPGVKPQLLLDAGRGAMGSPSVSFDGKWIYLSMAPEGESFYHLYRLPAGGGPAQRLTDGPFHDIDPCELPDGRIAFTSTRSGTFEEYHNSPSRALFAMTADGKDIKPITSTFIFDNEPEVLADGRILLIRSDNFFDRGKVETLLHAMYPDGTSGHTEFGLDLGPEYGGRLRAFNCGSPAPLADGRVAFVTGGDIVVGRPGAASPDWQHFRVPAGDVAALPDNRLLCTSGRGASYTRIGIVDRSGRQTILYDAGKPLHSPVYLGPRQRPPVLTAKANESKTTGVLFCQNARFTRNTTAGWLHVRAIRVLAGQGLTTRSSHSYIVHAGSEVIELGTVPLAPDGSFAVEVPADTAIAFQAVDAEGRSELNEMSWIAVRPGEMRGCVGCHQPRQAAPPAAARNCQATEASPLKLLGQGAPHRFRGNNAAVTGLMELQFDRYREVAGMNRHTESAAALIGRLQGTDVALKLSAAQRLAVFRAREAAPALAAGLRDTNRDLRVASAMALAACGTLESVAPLRAALDDADLWVRQAARLALENLTGDTTEAELIRRLQSPNRDVVRRAAVALGHTGSAAALPALRDYLRRERDNNPLPAWRRTHQGDGARFNALDPVNPRTLQAVTRALGYLGDRASVPLLAETLRQHSVPATGNLFLAEAAAEALGRIGTPEAEAALIAALAGLRDYPEFTSWYGDHSALMACHASPVHYFIIAALDALNVSNATHLIPQLIQSVPTDFDRGLLLNNDDYEAVTARVINRNDPQATVIETCLALLGDAQAVAAQPVTAALKHVQGAWGGTPTPEIRAAQILSMVCNDPRYEARVRAAFERYRQRPNTIQRVFATGIPVVNALPDKHWCGFYLARTLGNIAAQTSVEPLIAVLAGSPAEAASGRPDPLGPGVLFLHNDLTPCWRAAVAWALGRLGDPRAAPALLQIVRDLDNAPDTRHAAAEALGCIDAPSSWEQIRKLAAQYPEVATRKVLERIGKSSASADSSRH